MAIKISKTRIQNKIQAPQFITVKSVKTEKLERYFFENVSLPQNIKICSANSSRARYKGDPLGADCEVKNVYAVDVNGRTHNLCFYFNDGILDVPEQCLSIGPTEISVAPDGKITFIGRNDISIPDSLNPRILFSQDIDEIILQDYYILYSDGTEITNISYKPDIKKIITTGDISLSPGYYYLLGLDTSSEAVFMAIWRILDSVTIEEGKTVYPTIKKITKSILPYKVLGEPREGLTYFLARAYEDDGFYSSRNAPTFYAPRNYKVTEYGIEYSNIFNNKEGEPFKFLVPSYPVFPDAETYLGGEDINNLKFHNDKPLLIFAGFKYVNRFVGLENVENGTASIIDNATAISSPAIIPPILATAIKLKIDNSARAFRVPQSAVIVYDYEGDLYVQVSKRDYSREPAYNAKEEAIYIGGPDKYEEHMRTILNRGFYPAFVITDWYEDIIYGVARAMREKDSIYSLHFVSNSRALYPYEEETEYSIEPLTEPTDIYTFNELGTITDAQVEALPDFVVVQLDSLPPYYEDITHAIYYRGGYKHLIKIIKTSFGDYPVLYGTLEKAPRVYEGLPDNIVVFLKEIKTFSATVFTHYYRKFFRKTIEEFAREVVPVKDPYFMFFEPRAKVADIEIEPYPSSARAREVSGAIWADFIRTGLLTSYRTRKHPYNFPLPGGIEHPYKFSFNEIEILTKSGLFYIDEIHYQSPIMSNGQSLYLSFAALLASYLEWQTFSKIRKYTAPNMKNIIHVQLENIKQELAKYGIKFYYQYREESPGKWIVNTRVITQIGARDYSIEIVARS